MGPPVTIATFAIGNATKVDVQRSELQLGRNGQASEPTTNGGKFPH